ncbi:MAG: Alkanesulfonate ABC transporter permease protein SsuC, partial [uncultured Thermomicrobiales bacterium]
GDPAPFPLPRSADRPRRHTGAVVGAGAGPPALAGARGERDHPAPDAARPARGRPGGGRDGGRGQAGAARAGQRPAGPAGVRHRRRSRLPARSGQRLLRLERPPPRLQHADAADDPPPGADPAGHPLVRHRRDGARLPGRPGGPLPGLPEHLPRGPHRRRRAAGDGSQLRPLPLADLSPGDPAGGAALDPGRGPLRAGDHVADADRGRDDRRLVRHRQGDDGRPRVPPDRRPGLRHPPLRRPRQARRCRRKGTGEAAAGLAPELRPGTV